MVVSTWILSTVLQFIKPAFSQRSKLVKGWFVFCRVGKSSRKLFPELEFLVQPFQLQLSMAYSRYSKFGKGWFLFGRVWKTVRMAVSWIGNPSQWFQVKNTHLFFDAILKWKAYESYPMLGPLAKQGFFTKLCAWRRILPSKSEWSHFFTKRRVTNVKPDCATLRLTNSAKCLLGTLSY